MPEGREPIPASLERDLFVEAGHRCAIPTCRATASLEIDHIEDWARVKKHEFGNMIVLCANCHGRKGSGPRRIDKKALRQYKANLSLLNSRYAGVDRQLLDWFVAMPDAEVADLPRGTFWMVFGLIRDGIITHSRGYSVSWGNLDEGIVDSVRLTETGKKLVAHIREALPVDDLAE